MDLETLNQQRIEQLKQDLKKEMDSIHSQVVEIQSKFQVPDEVFRGYFAEYFKERLNTTPEDTKKLDPTKAKEWKKKEEEWITLAGGPYKEVDLVNRNGEVVDTVPSFYLHSTAANIAPVKIGHKGRDYIVNKNGEEVMKDIISIANEFDFKSNSKPKDIMITNLSWELNDYPIELNDSEKIKAHNKKWSEIITKYTDHLDNDDMTPEEIKKELKNIPQSVKDDLGLNYDD